MRVGLFNTNPAWGGGERWFLDAADALAERGHRVTRIGRRGTPLRERWGEAAHTAADLPALTSGPEPLDVVICNSGREVRRALRLMPRSAPTRLVLRRGLDRPLRDNWFRRRSWRRLAAILVNSDATAATVQASLPWFPRERIRRIHNPVAIPPAGDPPALKSPFRFAAVGRLVRQKGFDLLLRALVGIDRSVEWRLEVAGRGPLRAELEAQVDALGLGGRVTFLGSVDDARDVYARADVVVVPSRYEGFCFVAVEAALAGRPVVAARVSSLPEVVADGDTGLLVEPENPAALRDALLALVADPARARALGARGREWAQQQFAPGPIHDELEAFLTDVARRPRP